MSKWTIIAEKRRQLGFRILGRQCIKCGSTERLEFDHIDPNTKEINISALMHAPKAVFMKELLKCQVLCKDCHRKKTTQQLYAQPAGEEHGTVSMYKHGKCRCRKCVTAYNKAVRAYKARQKAKQERQKPQ